jgi:hypothetical protein
MEILVLDIIIGCYTQLLTNSLLKGLFGYMYFNFITKMEKKYKINVEWGLCDDQ